MVHDPFKKIVKIVEKYTSFNFDITVSELGFFTFIDQPAENLV